MRHKVVQKVYVSKVIISIDCFKIMTPNCSELAHSCIILVQVSEKVMKSIYTTLLAILVLLSMTACYEDFNRNSDKQVLEESEVFVDGWITGQVLNEDELPLSSIALELADHTLFTNQNGYFYVEAKEVLQYGELISLSDASGFEYLHTTRPFLNDVSNHTLYCKRPTLDQVAVQNQITKIPLDEGVDLELNEPEFQSNGMSYKDNIRVRSYHLGQDEIQSKNFAPLTRINSVELSLLDVKKIVHFQWDTEGNKRLDLTNDSKGAISLVNQEPGLGIFHFNQVKRQWQELEWIYVNGVYRGQIFYDGYYCLGKAKEAVRLTGQINFGGSTVSNATVNVRQNDGNIVDQTWSTNNGYYHVLVPRGEQVKVEIKDQCENLRGSRIINNFSASSENINIDVDEAYQYKGNVRNCENELQNNSFCTFTPGGYLFNSSGKIQNTVLNCLDVKTKLAAEANGLVMNESLLWRPKVSNHTQNLFLCSEKYDQYILIEIDGLVHFYTDTEVHVSNDGRTVLTAKKEGNDDFKFEVKISKTNEGVVDDNELNISFFDSGLGNDGYTLQCATSSDGCGFEAFEMTHFGDFEDDWITGEFTGKFWVLTTNRNPNLARNRIINANFRVKRTF